MTIEFLQTVHRCSSDSIINLFFEQVRALIPDFFFSNIFDVGANIGQSSIQFHTLAPKSKIYAFEPIPKSFQKLNENVGGIRSIKTFPLALAASEGQVTMTARGISTMNRVVTSKSAAGDTVTVEATTGDAFCRRNKITNISLLKIDTEGYDLEVLTGFQEVLKGIKFIQVEASMNNYNSYHKAMHKFDHFMNKRGFLLFHIYDQTFEWQDGGRPVLRRANLMFINAAIAEIETLNGSRFNK